MLKWRIGDVHITRVLDLEWKIDPTLLLPDVTPEQLGAHAAWLRPHFLEEDGRLLLSMHAFVVESEGRRVLIDTCVGADKERPVRSWNMRKGTFLEDLTVAGFPPESIDLVLCTHLHVDHVGWNTVLRDGRWVPSFPNARYLIARAEWDYWREEGDPFGTPVFEDSVEPLIEAGLVDLIETDRELGRELRLLPTPGHTPGHVSVSIESRGHGAIVTGDMLHHPVQCAHPRWKDAFDVDDARARETRISFLERSADQPLLVLGTHFPSPTAGHVVRDGAAWRFIAS